MCLFLLILMCIIVEWLKHSHGTDQPGEYSFNFFITHDVNQIADFSTCIPDSDTHRSALPDLFLYFRLLDYALLEAFAPLGNSDHVVVSVSGRLCGYFQKGCFLSS